jgi:Ni/Fe-hydrogenase subunit HybB-like protein
MFSYFPSFVEIIITMALLAGGILLFDFLTQNLPVYKSELAWEADPGLTGRPGILIGQGRS